MKSASIIPPEILQPIRFMQRRGSRILIVCVFLAVWYRTGRLWVPLVMLALYKSSDVLWWMWCRRKALIAAELPVPSVWVLLRTFFAERKRRERLKADWPHACLMQGVSGHKQLTPTLYRIESTLVGDVTAKIPRMGFNPAHIAAKADDLAKAVGCKEIVVKETSPGAADITFHWTDPMGRTLHLSDLPMSKPGTIAYAVGRDGTAATIEQDKSVLIGGLTGYGKSNIIWTMLADLIRKGVPTRLYVSDPKGGIELTGFSAATGEWMGNLQVMQYAANAEDTVAMVTDVEKRMRYSQSKQQGRKHTPTKENPLCVVILDELLPLHEMIGQKNKGSLGKILYEGRASGYVVWANAQTAHESVLGVLRNFIPQRISVKTKTPQMTDTILGAGAEARGASCSQLGPMDKGVGWADTDSSVRPEKFRAPLVKDTDIARIAKGAIPAGMPSEVKETRTAVYRALSADGKLLYVGISNKPLRRFEEHAKDKPWWPEVDMEATVKGIRWFDSEAKARVEERRAIKEEGPLHNVVHRSPIVAAALALPRPSIPQARQVTRRVWDRFTDHTTDADLEAEWAAADAAGVESFAELEQMEIDSIRARRQR